MVAAGGNDAEAVAVRCQVKVHLFDDRLAGSTKVDGDKAADCTGDLIHQTAGLAEVFIFCKLGNLCN